MKVDRTKIRKLQADVSKESRQLIEKIRNASSGPDGPLSAQLLEMLGGIKHWPVGKCELLHWVDVLDILDEVLAENARRVFHWSLNCDVGEKDKLRDLLLAVLNFTALLVEHSYSRHLYSSVEHLITLLGSSDLQICLSVLNLLYVFSKRSTFIQKLPPHLKSPLVGALLALAQGYGGRQNHLDLASCCKIVPSEDFATQSSIEAAESLYYEIPREVKTNPVDSSTIKISFENVKESVQDSQINTPGQLMDEIVSHYKLESLLVPPNSQQQTISGGKSGQQVLYELFNRLRLAFYFGERQTRIQCVEARLQALSILIYSNLGGEHVHSLLYPGIIREFSDCLILENYEDLIDIKAGVLKCLTSVIHLERHINHTEIVESMQISSYHGFLPDLVRMCVRQLTDLSENVSYKLPHSFITALFSFLYHLASYDGGSEALISSGTVKALLDVVGHHDNSDANVMFVTRAVRVLDLITNVEMTNFQQASGVTIFIDRLNYETKQCRISQPFEIRLKNASSSRGSATPDSTSAEVGDSEEPTLIIEYIKPTRTCYHQRGALMKSILNFIKRSIGDHTMADTVRHMMEGSLPDSLKHILSNCEYYGPSLFLLTAEIVSLHIFQEPSQMSYLQEIGLCDVLLYALLKLEIPPTREVLASLPGFLSSLCLNQAGLTAFLRYKPFDRLFKVLLTPSYLPAMRRRRPNASTDHLTASPNVNSQSTAYVLGQAMDELIRHQPSLRQSAMQAIVGLLEELIQIGTNTNENNPDGIVDAIEGDVPIYEYITNITRFIEAVLTSNSSTEHLAEFMLIRGPEQLLQIPFLSNIPLAQTGLGSAQTVAGLLKLVIQNYRDDTLIRALIVSMDAVLSDFDRIFYADQFDCYIYQTVNSSSNVPFSRVHRNLAIMNTFCQLILLISKSPTGEARSLVYGVLSDQIGLDLIRQLCRVYVRLVDEEFILASSCLCHPEPVNIDETIKTNFNPSPIVRFMLLNSEPADHQPLRRCYLPPRSLQYVFPILYHVSKTLRTLTEFFGMVNKISAAAGAALVPPTAPPNQRNPRNITFSNGAPNTVLQVMNDNLIVKSFEMVQNEKLRVFRVAHFVTLVSYLLMDERRRFLHLSLHYFSIGGAESAFFKCLNYLSTRITEQNDILVPLPTNLVQTPAIPLTSFLCQPPTQTIPDELISEKDVFGLCLSLLTSLLDFTNIRKSQFTVPKDVKPPVRPFNDVVFTLRIESGTNSLVNRLWNRYLTANDNLNQESSSPAAAATVKLCDQILQIIAALATDREHFNSTIERSRDLDNHEECVAALQSLGIGVLMGDKDTGDLISEHFYKLASGSSCGGGGGDPESTIIMVNHPKTPQPETAVSHLQVFLMNKAVDGQFKYLVEHMTTGLLRLFQPSSYSLGKIREIVYLVGVQSRNSCWINQFIKELCGRIIDDHPAMSVYLVLLSVLLQERPGHTASVISETELPQKCSYFVEIVNSVEQVKLLGSILLFLDLYMVGIRDAQRTFHLRQVLENTYGVWKVYEDRYNRWMSQSIVNNAMLTQDFIQGRVRSTVATMTRRSANVYFTAFLHISEDTRRTKPFELWMIPMRDKVFSAENTPNETADDLNVIPPPIHLTYGLDVRSITRVPFFLKPFMATSSQRCDPFHIKRPPDEPSEAQSERFLLQLIRILQTHSCLDSDVVHASMRLILRLTQSQSLCRIFVQHKGIEALFAIPASHAFLGIMSLTIMIIKHVLDTEQNLAYSMEKIIRYLMNTQNGRNPPISNSSSNIIASNHREIYSLMRTLTPVMCRNPQVFIETLMKTVKIADATDTNIQTIAEGCGSMIVTLRRSDQQFHMKLCDQTIGIVNLLLTYLGTTRSDGVITRAAVLRIMSELVRNYSLLAPLIMNHQNAEGERTFSLIIDRYVDIGSSDEELAPYARILVVNIASATTSPAGQRQLIQELQRSIRQCINQIELTKGSQSSLTRFQSIAVLLSLVVHSCTGGNQRYGTLSTPIMTFLKCLKESGLLRDLVMVFTKFQLNPAGESVMSTIQSINRAVDSLTKPFYYAHQQTYTGAIDAADPLSENQREPEQQRNTDETDEGVHGSVEPGAVEEARAPTPTAYVRIEQDEAGTARLEIDVESQAMSDENDDDEDEEEEEDGSSGDEEEEDEVSEEDGDGDGDHHDDEDEEDDTESSEDARARTNVARYSDCDEEHDEDDVVHSGGQPAEAVIVLGGGGNRDNEHEEEEEEDDDEEYSVDSDVEMQDALDHEIDEEVAMETEEDEQQSNVGATHDQDEPDVERHEIPVDEEILNEALRILAESDEDYDGNDIEIDDEGFIVGGADVNAGGDGDDDVVMDDEEEDGDEDDDEDDDEDHEPDDDDEHHVHIQFDLSARQRDHHWIINEDQAQPSMPPNIYADLYSSLSESGTTMSSWIHSAIHAACLASLTTENTSGQMLAQMHSIVANSPLVNAAGLATAGCATSGGIIPYGSNLVNTLINASSSSPAPTQTSVIASAAANAAAAAITYSSSLPMVHGLLLRRPSEFSSQSTTTNRPPSQRSTSQRNLTPNDAFYTASRAAATAASTSMGTQRYGPQVFTTGLQSAMATARFDDVFGFGGIQRLSRFPGARESIYNPTGHRNSSVEEAAFVAGALSARNPVSAILSDLGILSGNQRNPAQMAQQIQASDSVVVPPPPPPPPPQQPAQGSNVFGHSQLSLPTHATTSAAAAADILLAPMVRWIEECLIVDGVLFHPSTTLQRQQVILRLYSEVQSTFRERLNEYWNPNRTSGVDSQRPPTDDTGTYYDQEMEVQTDTPSLLTTAAHDANFTDTETMDVDEDLTLEPSTQRAPSTEPSVEPERGVEVVVEEEEMDVDHPQEAVSNVTTEEPESTVAPLEAVATTEQSASEPLLSDETVQETTEPTTQPETADNAEDAPVEYVDLTIEGRDYRVPSWVDHTFLLELPHDLRLEVIQQQNRIAREREQRRAAALVGRAEPAEEADNADDTPLPEVNEDVLAEMGISVEFLTELPRNIQAEIMESVRIQETNRRRAEQVQMEDVANNNDPAEFLRVLNPTLRQQIFLELDDTELSALPDDLAQEASALRFATHRTRAFRGVARRNLLRNLRNRGAGIILSRDEFDNLDMLQWAADEIMEDREGHGGATLSVDIVPRIFRGSRLARRGGRPLTMRDQRRLQVLQTASDESNASYEMMDLEVTNELTTILLVNLFFDDNRQNINRVQRIVRNLAKGHTVVTDLIASLCLVMMKCTGRIECVLGDEDEDEDAELVLVEPQWLRLTRTGPFGIRVPSLSFYKRLNKNPTDYPTHVCLDEHASKDVCRRTLDMISFISNFTFERFINNHLDPLLIQSGDLFWRGLIQAEMRFVYGSSSPLIPQLFKQPTEGCEDIDCSIFATLVLMVEHPILRKDISLLESFFVLLANLSYHLEKYEVFCVDPPESPIQRKQLRLKNRRRDQTLSTDTRPLFEGIAMEKQIDALIRFLVNANDPIDDGPIPIKMLNVDNITDVLTNISQINKATHSRIMDRALNGLRNIGRQLEEEIRFLYQESAVYEMLEANKLIGGDGGGGADSDTEDETPRNSGAKKMHVPAMQPFIKKQSTQGFFLQVLKVVLELRRLKPKTRQTNRSGVESRDNDAAAATLEPTSGEEQMQSAPQVSAEPPSSEVIEETPKFLSTQLDLGDLWTALDVCLTELQNLNDSQTLLLLQPSVEAFFLVHSPPSASQNSNRRRRVNARTEREQRALNLAHLIEISTNEPVSTEPQQQQQQQQQQQALQPSSEVLGRQASSSSGMDYSYTEMAIREHSRPTADETVRNKNLFLSFANSHSKMLNHILRQSQSSLLEGPFSVLCDYTHILDFDVKRKYFQEELINLKSMNLREEVNVTVRRDHLFEDSYRELNRRSVDEWKRRFYVTFEQEEGQDAGGLLREWYSVISKEIFNPNYALFMVNPSDRVTYMPNPASHANPSHLSYFKFVGRVIGKAIFDSKHLDCYFTRFFYKHILGVPVDYSDMESVDHDFYKNLCLILETDASAYELNFSTDVQEFGVTKTIDLKENGRNIPVTNENKHEYVRLLCHEKMIGSIRPQLLSFLDGFYSIIPKRLISIFDEHELELLISGLPDIDVEDLRANTEYHKYRSNSMQIQWLWRALRSFEKDDLAKFVQFVTGTSKVPLGGFAFLEGMNGPQKMQIHRDERSSNRLPCAHTCFNQLDLPVYETYDKLRQCLLTAIHECQFGFGLA